MGDTQRGRWAQQIADGSRGGLSRLLRRIVLPALTKLDELGGRRRLVVLWIAGSFCLILVSLACFQLGLDFASAAFAFLIIIVVLSLLDSLISSVVFSIIAFISLNYFFVEPLYTPAIRDTQDLIALVAFLITSLSVATLVRRVRLSVKQSRLAETQLRAAIKHGLSPLF